MNYRDENASKWRKVKLEYNGKKYDVKMSLLGDLANHYSNTKKSFKIKADENILIDKTRRLNFYIAEDKQFFAPMFAEELANMLGLVVPDYEIGLVYINGIGYGLYTIEDDLDEILMEKNKQPGTIIISLSDNWLEDRASLGIKSHITPFDLEISNYNKIDSPFSEQIAYRLKKMLDAVKDNNQELFEIYFDVEQVARFEAFRVVLGQFHDFRGDNLRLFYDTTKGKFGLVPRSEGGIDALSSFGCSIDETSIIGFISRNMLVIERKSEILKGLDKNSLVVSYDSLQEKYGLISSLDSTSTRRSSKTDYYFNRNRKNLIANLEFLEECI